MIKNRKLLLGNACKSDNDGQWVKCADMLPKNNTCVLAILQKSNTQAYDVVAFSDNIFYGQEYGYVVTHWQYLPEPPTK